MAALPAATARRPARRAAGTGPDPAGPGSPGSPTWPSAVARPRIRGIWASPQPVGSGMEFDLTRLRIFREVAARRSFTAAAAALGLTQPAVSQQVAKLERELDAVLLDRSSRVVVPTAPGRALLVHTEAVLRRLEEARREVAELSRPEGGELHLAAFPSAAVTIVAPVIAAWCAAAPGARVRLTEGDPPQTLPAVLRGDVDVALAYEYGTPAVPHDARLRWSAVAHDPMAVALPAGHPLTAAAAVEPGALADEPWITPHESGCLDALLEACRRAGFTPRTVFRTNDYVTMLGLVRAGVGVAVVPRLLAIGAMPDGVTLRHLAGSPLVRTISAVTRDGGYRAPGLDRLLHVVRDVVPRLGSPQVPLVPAA